MRECGGSLFLDQLPLLKALHIQMKASIGLLFYIHKFILFLFILHKECISRFPPASPVSPSVCLTFLQEPASLLLEHSTSRALAPGAQPAQLVGVRAWGSWWHLLSVVLLLPREELHHPPDSECLVSLLTACTIRVCLHDLEGEPEVQQAKLT